MKVCYITMLFPSPAETFACNDVSALSSIGVDISVHSLRRSAGDIPGLTAERGLGGVRLTYNSVLNSFRGVLFSATRPSLSFSLASWILKYTAQRPVHLVKSLVLFPRVMQLYSEIERINPDVVHLFWGHYPSMLAFLVKKNLPGVLLSVSLGAYDLGASYGGSRAIIKEADIVVTFARANIPCLLEMGVPSGKLRVVYRGIAPEKYERWISGEVKIKGKIATAGRLIPGKGMDDVITVFARINKKRPETFLVIMGTGPESGRLNQLAYSLGVGEKVDFKGHVPHSEVLRALRSSELFLFMSVYENERLPNAVKEALFCECFTVVARTPGIEEIIPDAGYGFIAEPGGVDSAARKALEFLSAPEKFSSVTERARRHISLNFDVRKEMKKLKQYWEEIQEKKQ